jgi:hypothetical protein
MKRRCRSHAASISANTPFRDAAAHISENLDQIVTHLEPVPRAQRVNAMRRCHCVGLAEGEAIVPIACSQVVIRVPQWRHSRRRTNLPGRERV